MRLERLHDEPVEEKRRRTTTRTDESGDYSNLPGMRERNSSRYGIRLEGAVSERAGQCRIAPASVGTSARSRRKPGVRRTESDGGYLKKSKDNFTFSPPKWGRLAPHSCQIVG